MIAPTILNIFLHGMIALVHDRPSSGSMSAYVLNNDDHYTFISFQVTSPSQCGVSAKSFGWTECFDYGGLCECYIGDPVHLEFYPPSSVNDVKLPHRVSSRPFNRTEASDLSWLVRMSDVNGDAGGAKALGAVRDSVLADLSFGWQKAQTCHLDQVDEGCTDGGTCQYRIYPDRFQSSVSGSSGHVQALAEEVMFEVGFPSDRVRLFINQRDGGGKIELDLGCTNHHCPDLLIANNPYGGAHEMFEDIGAHFLEYYDLAAQDHPKKRFPVRLKEGAVPFSVRDLPLFTCSSNPEEENRARLEKITGRKIMGPLSFDGKKRDFTQAELAELYDVVILGVQTRIICPMVVFEN